MADDPEAVVCKWCGGTYASAGPGDDYAHNTDT